MERFERFAKNISKYFEWAGVIGLLSMFFANIIDVVGAKFFKWPLPGALEIISFSQVVAIAPAIAFGLFLGTHLRIDFIVEKFPKILKFSLGLFVSFLCMILFFLLFWQAMRYGYSLQRSGEIGSVSKMPLFPFAYVIAISCIPVIFYFIVEILKQMRMKE